MREIYLDNSATTRVDDEVAEQVLSAMCQTYGNPSSLHSKGLEAELLLTAARKQVAAALGAQPEQIVFTSGGTEANNLALLGSMQKARRMGGRVVISAVEHSSVLAAAAELERLDCEVVRVPPDAFGRVSASSVLEAVDTHTVLVSTMLVNNEVGAITPVAEIAQGVRRICPDALYHCDAVQAWGKLPIKMAKLGVDMLTVSGHKVYAPKGVGVLAVRRGLVLAPRTFGGAQERGLRTGTEPTPLIIGLGAAASLLNPAATARRDEVLSAHLLEGVNALPEVLVNSPPDALPAVVNLSVPGVRSETMLHFLEAQGIYVSSGSACAKGEISHVLRAMGLAPKRIDSALRISFGKYNTPEDVAQFLTVLEQGIRTLRR